MREEFENLPEISEILEDEKVHINGDVYSLPFNSCAEQFINGAWYAFQEQQKKIYEIKKHMDSFYAEAELWGFDSDQALHQIDLIQELLK